MSNNIKKMDSLKDIINIKCDLFSDKVAFLDKEETKEYKKITYKKVKEDVNALGTAMIKKLNLSDQKVAVIGENSYKWYATYMAVVCGVGVIVPLDKELPASEILNLLKRSKAKAIVFSSRRSELICSIMKDLPSDMVYIEMGKDKSDDKVYAFDELIKEGKKISKKDNFYENIKIDTEKFSILLFTSGTTAKSKGVMLNHRNVTSNIYSSNLIVPNFSNYTSLSILPMHHTYEFTLDYLLMTSMGATVGICEGLKYITKNLQEVKPDFILAVPALIEKVYQKIEKGIKETGKEKLIKSLGTIALGLNKIGIDFRRVLFKKVHQNLGGNLKYIFCGAAPLDPDLIYKMESLGFNFLQGYGLTETSPLSAGTTMKFDAHGTVGKAVEGTEIRIDLSGNEDENSNVGEIIVKGPNVMMGYFEDEEETKKALRKGWFYTGDIGYFDLRGNLVITGRSKNVIVTQNGKKIFPEELENLVNKIPLVQESMVYGKKENKEELLVTARVTLNEEYIKDTFKENRPTDEQIYEMIWSDIKKINRNLSQYKVIKALEIKSEDFVKTTTMKIKRFEEIKKK